MSLRLKLFTFRQELADVIISASCVYKLPVKFKFSDKLAAEWVFVALAGVRLPSCLYTGSKEKS